MMKEGDIIVVMDENMKFSKPMEPKSSIFEVEYLMPK